MSTRPTYDVAVVGLGAAGSCAAWHAARRGARVIGVDRWRPPHTHGSTHGRSRIIREAYYEHPSYVPLVRRAYEWWAELEAEGDTQLFRRTGGWMIGPAGGALVAGALASAVTHQLPHEMLTAREAREQVPGFAVPDDFVVLTEPRAGMLFPERCVSAALATARRLGAELCFDTSVRRCLTTNDAVRLDTESGPIDAGAVILAAGPWLTTLVPELDLPLTVERQLSHWLAPAAHAEGFDADRCPVTIWEHEPDRLFYTLPDVGDGFKLGIHHEGATVDPDTPTMAATATETAEVVALARRWMPDVAGRVLDIATCLYTNTPDTHFIIDRHPLQPQVVIASACSGHGFKFASAVGDAVAALALGSQPDEDLGFFSLARLLKRG